MYLPGNLLSPHFAGPFHDQRTPNVTTTLVCSYTSSTDILRGDKRKSSQFSPALLVRKGLYSCLHQDTGMVIWDHRSDAFIAVVGVCEIFYFPFLNAGQTNTSKHFKSKKPRFWQKIMARIYRYEFPNLLLAEYVLTLSTIKECLTCSDLTSDHRELRKQLFRFLKSIKSDLVNIWNLLWCCGEIKMVKIDVSGKAFRCRSDIFIIYFF